MVYAEERHHLVANVLSNIKHKKYAVPLYQRDYVWDAKSRAAFTNNIIKACDKVSRASMGSIITHTIDSNASGNRVTYVVDGRQRLTSLLWLVHGEHWTGKAVYTGPQILDKKITNPGVDVGLVPFNGSLTAIELVKSDMTRAYAKLALLHGGVVVLDKSGRQPKAKFHYFDENGQFTVEAINNPIPKRSWESVDFCFLGSLSHLSKFYSNLIDNVTVWQEKVRAAKTKIEVYADYQGNDPAQLEKSNAAQAELWNNQANLDQVKRYGASDTIQWLADISWLYNHITSTAQTGASVNIEELGSACSTEAAIKHFTNVNSAGSKLLAIDLGLASLVKALEYVSDPKKPDPTLEAKQQELTESWQRNSNFVLGGSRDFLGCLIQGVPHSTNFGNQLYEKSLTHSNQEFYNLALLAHKLVSVYNDLERLPFKELTPMQKIVQAVSHFGDTPRRKGAIIALGYYLSETNNALGLDKRPNTVNLRNLLKIFAFGLAAKNAGNNTEKELSLLSREHSKEPVWPKAAEVSAHLSEDEEICQKFAWLDGAKVRARLNQLYKESVALCDPDPDTDTSMDLLSEQDALIHAEQHTPPTHAAAKTMWNLLQGRESTLILADGSTKDSSVHLHHIFPLKEKGAADSKLRDSWLNKVFLLPKDNLAIGNKSLADYWQSVLDKGVDAQSLENCFLPTEWSTYKGFIIWWDARGISIYEVEEGARRYRKFCDTDKALSIIIKWRGNLVQKEITKWAMESTLIK